MARTAFPERAAAVWKAVAELRGGGGEDGRRAERHWSRRGGRGRGKKERDGLQKRKEKRRGGALALPPCKWRRAPRRKKESGEKERERGEKEETKRDKTTITLNLLDFTGGSGRLETQGSLSLSSLPHVPPCLTQSGNQKRRSSFLPPFLSLFAVSLYDKTHGTHQNVDDPAAATATVPAAPAPGKRAATPTAASPAPPSRRAAAPPTAPTAPPPRGRGRGRTVSR